LAAVRRPVPRAVPPRIAVRRGAPGGRSGGCRPSTRYALATDSANELRKERKRIYVRSQLHQETEERRDAGCSEDRQPAVKRCMGERAPSLPRSCGDGAVRGVGFVEVLARDVLDYRVRGVQWARSQRRHDRRRPAAFHASHAPHRQPLAGALRARDERLAGVTSVTLEATASTAVTVETELP
jgi:hypothetical protein